MRMGFNLSEIKNIIEKKLQTSGENYTSVEVLVADLINAQKANAQEGSSENPLIKGEHFKRQNIYEDCLVLYEKKILLVHYCCHL